MSDNYRKTFHRQYIIVIALNLSVIMIGGLTYGENLGYFFTAVDTLSLIETSIVSSFNDFVNVLTQPLMVGTKFASDTLYYRPLASLSYSLDYHIWGLNPFGYHLTNLILHVTVSVLVFVTIYLLTGGRKAISWFCAVIFTTHPVLIECVPAIARRHDIIAALFQLLSLILFINCVSAKASRKKWYLLSSLIVFILALGAKEISIMLPFVLCGYLFAFEMDINEKISFVKKLRPLKICIPYFSVTAVYILWRGYVIGGIGGVNQPYTLSPLDIFNSYFSGLLYPVQIYGVAPENKILAPALVFILILITYLFAGWKPTLKNVQRSETGKTAVFMLIWLLLPFGLLQATHTFSYWNLYVSIIPFSAVLSITFIESLLIFVGRSHLARTGQKFLPFSAGGSMIIASTLVIYLISFSPLIRTYGEWEDSGKISSIILHKLSEAVKALPDNSTIHVYDLPAGISEYATITPHVKSVRYLADYSIKSYLVMTNPYKRIEVVVINSVDLPKYPGDINLEIKKETDSNVAITIKTVE